MEKKMYETPEMEEIKLKMEGSMLDSGGGQNTAQVCGYCDEDHGGCDD